MIRDPGKQIRLLCAGAAQGLVEALEEQFLATSGARLECRFGAVGAMRKALVSGEPCDIIVVTRNVIFDLQKEGYLVLGSGLELGEVPTGIGVRSSEPLPDVSTEAALRFALLEASEIYFPDPQLATAGIHFTSVLTRLGIASAVNTRLRTFPNGAKAMFELVARSVPGAIGCTQITEIKRTTGMDCVGPLPHSCGLRTTYCAAVSAHASQSELATAFVRLVAGPETRGLRRKLGFEDTMHQPEP